jgi:hypothetical protein
MEAPGHKKNPKSVVIIKTMVNRTRSWRRRRRAGGEVLGWNLDTRRVAVSIFARLCEGGSADWERELYCTYLWGEMEYVSLLARGYPFE